MVLIVAAVAALLGGVVMLWWNAVVAMVFVRANPIDSPVPGLLILGRILFGGFRGRGGTIATTAAPFRQEPVVLVPIVVAHIPHAGIRR